MTAGRSYEADTQVDRHTLGSWTLSMRPLYKGGEIKLGSVKLKGLNFFIFRSSSDLLLLHYF